MSWVLLGCLGIPSALVSGCGVVVLVQSAHTEFASAPLWFIMIGDVGMCAALSVFFAIRAARKTWRGDVVLLIISIIALILLGYYTFFRVP